jgi:hypothetical protein
VSRERIKEIVLNGSKEERLALYSFDVSLPTEKIYKKFSLFARAFFPRYFKHKSAPFHEEMVKGFIDSYRGGNYVLLAFRGSAKTTYKKLFDVFALLNDEGQHRKYMKVLTKDGKNSRQVVTDVYNLIVEAGSLYGDVFAKEGDIKREETMSSFTMKNGRKYSSGTVGQTQRGHIQDAYRPDWIWFDDVEDRESIESISITEGIINKCDEAITGLSIDGNYCVTGNYISEQGSIQWFVDRKNAKKLIVPILENDKPTWDVYTETDILHLREDSVDFYGEYMCDPTRTADKFFDIARLEEDLKNVTQPTVESAGVRYWGYYLPHHRYGMGADVSEGVGLDSSTLALWDFTDGLLVATYFNRNIAPDMFGHELMRVGREFGNCVIAPERNNHGHATILSMATYPNIFTERRMGHTQIKNTDKLGWITNRKTKPQMFFEFRKDYNDGLIKIKDKNVLKEMKSYTTADLVGDSGTLVTRHFDLLTAVVIGWQMKNYAGYAVSDSVFEEERPLFDDIGV